MNVWFTRSNGTSVHDMEGEPKGKFDYRETCLADGFARIGWPGAGDLRRAGWRQEAASAYGCDPTSRVIARLAEFASIEVGDLILIPAARGGFDVHMGSVLAGYRYVHDPSRGDWYENAHRVLVEWCRGEDGEPIVFYIPVSYRTAFSRVVKGRDEAIRLHEQHMAGAGAAG